MVNKVILIGSLGADPEIRYTNNSTAVANISLATSEKYKNKEGKYEDQTEWHRLTAWGKLAEICAEYLQKGAKIYVEGKLSTRKWQDHDGKDRYTTEIVMREMKMLSPRQGSGSHGGGDGGDHPPGPPHVGDDVPF